MSRGTCEERYPNIPLTRSSRTVFFVPIYVSTNGPYDVFDTEQFSSMEVEVRGQKKAVVFPFFS